MCKYVPYTRIYRHIVWRHICIRHLYMSRVPILSTSCQVLTSLVLGVRITYVSHVRYIPVFNMNAALLEQDPNRCRAQSICADVVWKPIDIPLTRKATNQQLKHLFHTCSFEPHFLKERDSRALNTKESPMFTPFWQSSTGCTRE